MATAARQDHTSWTACAQTAIAIAIALATALASGCSPSYAPRFVADAGTLTAEKVELLTRDIDLAPVAGIDVEHAPAARRDALVWLRRQGALGERAATLLTEGFPDRTASVPLLVEIARVDGVRSLVVIEAFGTDSGALRYRRLWLFDLATGDLLLSTAFR